MTIVGSSSTYYKPELPSLVGLRPTPRASRVLVDCGVVLLSTISELSRQPCLLAGEIPRWGYQQTVGELAGIWVNASATMVRTILRHYSSVEET